MKTKRVLAYLCIFMIGYSFSGSGAQYDLLRFVGVFILCFTTYMSYSIKNWEMILFAIVTLLSFFDFIHNFVSPF
jgi:hypothetical protein